MQKRQTTIYVFLGFLALSIIVVLIFKISIFSPLSSFTQTIFSPLTSTAHSIFRLNSSADSMRENYLDLSQKLVNQSKIEADNKALRDQFQTQNVKSNTLIEASIVGSPSFIPGVTMPEYYILDKGQRDGLVKGQQVIYKDNLVGKVSEVTYGFSKVNLLTNSSFSTTAQDLSSNAMGVVKGQGGGELILDNVVLSQDLKVGDLIVTKGDQGINGEGILPNLVLGKVSSINKNPSSLFQVAKMQTLINFSELSKVFIIKN